MTDRLTPAERSRNMSHIKAKNTCPELIVRSCIHRLGYRFRLHDRGLPGIPDIVLPRLRTVIFVHGCFWHRHARCRYAYTPKSRIDFWAEKFRRNVQRDRRARKALQSLGWHVVVVWECETWELHALTSSLLKSLGGRVRELDRARLAVKQGDRQ